MNFRKATDELLSGNITHDELADTLGVSVATVRQARLDESAKAHRNAPEGWEPKMARLARTRGAALQRLADRLTKAN